MYPFELKRFAIASASLRTLTAATWTTYPSPGDAVAGGAAATGSLTAGAAAAVGSVAGLGLAEAGFSGRSGFSDLAAFSGASNFAALAAEGLSPAPRPWTGAFAESGLISSLMPLDFSSRFE